MDWVKSLNKAITYMEECMTEDIDFDKVARIACCSSYQFQRMFAFMADVPLSEYIRRRKMSLAAVDLKSGEKVLDVSLKYGYSSPTAFNRAFQGVHGVAPSRIKDESVILTSYPPISFRITVKGADGMNFRIEKKNAFRVVGLSQPLCGHYEDCVETVSQTWENSWKDGTLNEINKNLNVTLETLERAAREGNLNKLTVAPGVPAAMMGVNICYDKRTRESFSEGGDWRYLISVPTEADKGELEEYIVPALTWAVFPGKGSFFEDLPQLCRRVVTEWFPNSGYEYADGPDIEVLFPTQDVHNADFEVWLPVRRLS